MKRRFGALSLAVAATLFFGQRAEASSHDVETGLLRDDADAQDKLCKDARAGDDKAKVRKGAGSWTRAAAVHADSFPNCR
jgi:hypothetical protein